jgi:hypothetical protein
MTSASIRAILVGALAAIGSRQTVVQPLRSLGEELVRVAGGDQLAVQPRHDCVGGPRAAGRGPPWPMLSPAAVRRTPAAFQALRAGAAEARFMKELALAACGRAAEGRAPHGTPLFTRMPVRAARRSAAGVRIPYSWILR